MPAKAGKNGNKRQHKGALGKAKTPHEGGVFLFCVGKGMGVGKGNSIGDSKGNGVDSLKEYAQ